MQRENRERNFNNTHRLKVGCVMRYSTVPWNSGFSLCLDCNLDFFFLSRCPRVSLYFFITSDKVLGTRRFGEQIQVSMMPM